MTSDDQHSALVNAWVPVHELMLRLPSSLQWDDVQFMDVTDMADRVRGLALHLDSAVDLSSNFRYDQLQRRHRGEVAGMADRPSSRGRLDDDGPRVVTNEEGRRSNRA